MAAAALVRQSAEQRQHKQSQNVIQSHDHAGQSLVHTEFIGEEHGDGCVIGLPESADQEKGKAHQNGAFIAELHRVSSVFVDNSFIIAEFTKMSSYNTLYLRIFPR